MIRIKKNYFENRSTRAIAKGRGGKTARGEVGKTAREEGGRRQNSERGGGEAEQRKGRRKRYTLAREGEKTEQQETKGEREETEQLG